MHQSAFCQAQIQVHPRPIPCQSYSNTKDLDLDLTVACLPLITHPDNFSGASKKFKPLLYDFKPIDLDIQDDIQDYTQDDETFKTRDFKGVSKEDFHGDLEGD